MCVGLLFGACGPAADGEETSAPTVDTLSQATEIPFPVVDPLTIYTMKQNGDLWRHRTISRVIPMGAPDLVGWGWEGFKDVIAGANGLLYALTTDGKLIWYQHNGTAGVGGWTIRPVKSGFGQYSKIFSGADGIIYAIKPSGQLDWYRHTGYLDGSNNWLGPRQVGVGWNMFKDVFSMGEGIIYGIHPGGSLYWYNHKGYKTGANDWTPSQIIASAWHQFQLVGPTGNGGILALNTSGELWFYKHKNYLVGTDFFPNSPGPIWYPTYRAIWDTPVRLKTGWFGIKDMMPMLPDKGL